MASTDTMRRTVRDFSTSRRGPWYQRQPGRSESRTSFDVLPASLQTNLNVQNDADPGIAAEVLCRCAGKGAEGSIEALCAFSFTVAHSHNVPCYFMWPSCTWG